MQPALNTVNRVLTDGSVLSKTGIAFRRAEETLTYQALDVASRTLATRLAASGLDPGDKVAVALGNDFDYPVAYFGIQRAGGVVVPLNPGSTGRERDFTLAHSDARWLAVGAGWTSSDPADPGPRFEGVLRLDGRGGIARGGGTVRRRKFDLPADDCEREGVLLYTSGTTGVPNGVLLTQGNIVTNARSVVSYLRLSAFDRHAVFLPLFYSYGMSQMLTTLLAGGEVVLFDGLLYPAEVLEAMRRGGVTIVAGVPTSYNLLVRLAAFNGESFPSLRTCLNAGGPIHPDRLKELCERFPRAEIINSYGCTEAGPRVTFLPHVENHRRGSIGIPIPGVEVTLRDEGGRVVGPGELGEITIQGPSVMKGYHKNEVATRRSLTPQGLRSGDWATVDKDGFFYFKGRKVDIINTGGEKVSAREVEEVLLEHPAVREVAVVGEPDPVLGEAVRAVVVAEDDARVSEEEILRFAGTLLSRHKIPRTIRFTKQLARTPGGKIRKIDFL